MESLKSRCKDVIINNRIEYVNENLPRDLIEYLIKNDKIMVGDMELKEISYWITDKYTFNKWNDYYNFVKQYSKNEFFVAIYVLCKKPNSSYWCNGRFYIPTIKGSLSKKDACDIDFITNNVYRYLTIYNGYVNDIKEDKLKLWILNSNL